MSFSHQNKVKTERKKGVGTVSIVWEELDSKGLGIYRDTEGFTYGHDAVLLASFARFYKNETVLDIGTGTGILALLVHAAAGSRVDAIDISPECCALAEKSIQRNGLSGKLRVFRCDIRSLPNKAFGSGSYDGIICNPPYHSGGTVSENKLRAGSTHLLTCTLQDIAAAAGKLLKNGGKAFLCYPASGLSAFCAAFEQQSLAVKRLCFVRSKREKPPYLFLAEVKKGGGAGLILEDDIILEER